MKHLLLTTIAAVVLVGCATKAKRLSPAAKVKLFEPIAEVPAQPLKPFSEADKALINAALTGNLEAAKHAIVNDANLNVEGSGRWTPMHFAAWGGYNEVVKLLITKEADLNAEDVNGKTPIDWAKGKTADLLRKYGGKTSEELSIHVAAERGNITVVKQHLAAGENVNAKDRAGKTPLDRSITNYQSETADLLRKHGGKTGEELEAEGK